MTKIQRGEIWLVDCPDGRGHEQNGRRPALVLGGGNGLYAIVPLTSNMKCLDFLFSYEIDPTKENGLMDISVVLVHQLVTFDASRFVKRMGYVTNENLDAVGELIKNFLSLQ